MRELFLNSPSANRRESSDTFSFCGAYALYNRDACISVGAFSERRNFFAQKVWKSNCRRARTRGGRSTTINHSAAQFGPARKRVRARVSEKSSQPSTPVCQTYKHKQNASVGGGLTLSCVCVVCMCSVDAPRLLISDTPVPRAFWKFQFPCIISIRRWNVLQCVIFLYIAGVRKWREPDAITALGNSRGKTSRNTY